MSQWIDVNDLLDFVSNEEVLELDRYSPRPTMSTYRLRRSAKFLEQTKDLESLGLPLSLRTLHE